MFFLVFFVVCSKKNSRFLGRFCWFSGDVRVCLVRICFLPWLKAVLLGT